MSLRDEQLVPWRNYTYQELAEHWSVSATTVKRWLSSLPGLFAPSGRTVRIPGLIASNFYKINISNGRKKPSISEAPKKKSRTVLKPKAGSRRAATA